MQSGHNAKRSSLPFIHHYVCMLRDAHQLPSLISSQQHQALSSHTAVVRNTEGESWLAAGPLHTGGAGESSSCECFL